MPEASFTHRATTAAGLGTVWERLQVPATWATVAGVDETFDHAHDHDGRLRGFRFATSIGGISYRGDAKVTASELERSMTVSIRSSELTGSIVVMLTPEQPVSILDVSMTMRPAGLMGSMVFPLVSAAVRSGFADSVDRLAADPG